VLGALAICARQAAAADVPDCAPKSRDVGDGDSLSVAGGFTSIDHVEKGTTSAWTNVAGWQPADKWTSADTGQLKAQAPDRVRLVFTKADHTKCAQEVTLKTTAGGSPPPAGTPPPSNSETPPTEGSFEDCRQKGEAWAREMTNQSHGAVFTMLVFMNSGEICYRNRQESVEGDPIYVGIYSDKSSDKWQPVQFSPCSLEDAAPSIFVSADTVRLSSAQTTNWSLLRIAPRTCFNESVGIKVSGKINGNDAQIAFTLLQYRLYRATLQLGVGFTTQHASDFGVVTNAAGQSVIHDSAATGRGPEYVVSLVIYGLPNYLFSLFSGPAYRGRDILHQQGFFDRIGLVTGVGLTDPTRRFILGGSFEVVYGLNALFVAEAYRHNELDGVAAGDMFMGAASDIPTHDVWHTKFVFGLSLDLRYVQEIFAGHVHP
jgi:hypothetical protein